MRKKIYYFIIFFNLHLTMFSQINKSKCDNFLLSNDKSFFFKDSNTTVVFKNYNLVSFYNYDSSIVYNDTLKELSVNLDYQKSDPKSEIVKFLLGSNIPIIKYLDKSIQIDTMYKFLSNDAINKSSILNLKINECFISASIVNKNVEKIFFNSYKRHCILIFYKNYEKNKFYWKYFEQSPSNNEFIVSNNYDGYFNLIHYYNTNAKFGFYLPSFKKKNNKFYKVYEYNNPLSQKVRTYDDSRVTINLKNKSLYSEKMDILNWQYEVYDILKIEGTKPVPNFP